MRIYHGLYEFGMDALIW